VIALAFVFLFRFLHGKWKQMRVIEDAMPDLAATGGASEATEATLGQLDPAMR
jgi:hypothetical protein